MISTGSAVDERRSDGNDVLPAFLGDYGSSAAASDSKSIVLITDLYKVVIISVSTK